jgi:hypothetical protein
MNKKHQPGPQPEPTKKANQSVPLHVVIDRVVALTNLPRAEVTKVIHYLLEKGGEHRGNVH